MKVQSVGLTFSAVAFASRSANGNRQFERHDTATFANDRNNVPFLCAPLPVAFVAPSCATPDKISDPKIRAQYVAAIDENNRKKQRLEYYLRVKHLDDQARSMLDMSLKIFNEIAPDDVGPDGAALESIFRSAGISARRLGQLHGMVYARAASRTNQIGL